MLHALTTPLPSVTATCPDEEDEQDEEEDEDEDDNTAVIYFGCMCQRALAHRAAHNRTLGQILWNASVEIAAAHAHVAWREHTATRTVGSPWGIDAGRKQGERRAQRGRTVRRDALRPDSETVVAAVFGAAQPAQRGDARRRAAPPHGSGL